MNDRRRPIPREEPDSDRPDYEDRPLAKPAFVTRAEMERYVSQMFAPVMAGINELRGEAVAARRERELRAQWDREQREREQFEAVREKTRSESDLIKAQVEALQRPQTPLQVIVPRASDSDPVLRKPMSRAMRWAVILVPVLLAIISTIGAVISQRTSPRGGSVPSAKEKP